jgi:hypothetical protein
VVIVLAIALLLFWWWVSTRSRKREKEFVDSRPSDTVETFVASFRPEVQPIARAMYAEFQQYAFSAKMPLRKSDPATKTLNIDKEDLDDALQRVANQFGCRKPTKEDDTKFRGRETFEDFVEFIHHLRTTEPPKAFWGRLRGPSPWVTGSVRRAMPSAWGRGMTHHPEMGVVERRLALWSSSAAHR